MRTMRSFLTVMAFALGAFYAAAGEEKGAEPETPKKEPAAPKADKVTLTGVVKATKDEWDDIIAVTLTVKEDNGEKVYNVVVQDKDNVMGLKLGYRHKDTMKVTGTLTQKDGQPWLTVDKYEKAASEDKGAAKPPPAAGGDGVDKPKDKAEDKNK
jgi:hypothetical protein